MSLADPGGLDVWDWLAEKIGPDNIAAWDCCLGDSRDGWFAKSSDFCAGWGDTLSFGITRGIRYLGDCDSVVNYDSGWYTAGEITGFVHSTALGGACGWRLAGGPGPGKEFSHWIPKRYGRPFRCYTKWIGNYVTVEVHAMSDPYRYNFMSKCFKDAHQPWPRWYQQWVRIPLVYKGMGCGAIYAGSSISAQKLLPRPGKGAHCHVGQIELIQFPIERVQAPQ